MPCLLVEPCDFTMPLYGGGGIAVAASAIRTLGERLVLVGTTSGPHKIGALTEIQAYGKSCKFLPVIHEDTLKSSWIGSENLRFAMALLMHRKKIEEIGLTSVLTQTYSVLWFFAFLTRGWDVCFYFPGFANPMTMGRRPKLGRFVGGLYDFVQSRALRKARIVFAAASREAIDAHQGYLRKQGTHIDIHRLPTAVDLVTFRPMSRADVRQEVGFSLGATIYVFVGRFARVKDLPFLLDAFKETLKNIPDGIMVLVGHGEEYENIMQLASTLGISERTRFMGLVPPEMVSKLVACANVCVVGSIMEGFSLAMIEQIACGRPIVSTDVSGAREMVFDGVNGFILTERNPKVFAEKMVAAVTLPEAERVSRNIAVDKFGERTLWKMACDLWPALDDK